MSSDRNEKKEISDGGDEEPRGAVFNALDAMLKCSLDRLKTTRFVLLHFLCFAEYLGVLFQFWLWKNLHLSVLFISLF